MLSRPYDKCTKNIWARENRLYLKQRVTSIRILPFALMWIVFYPSVRFGEPTLEFRPGLPCYLVCARHLSSILQLSFSQRSPATPFSSTSSTSIDQFDACSWTRYWAHNLSIMPLKSTHPSIHGGQAVMHGNGTQLWLYRHKLNVVI